MNIQTAYNTWAETYDTVRNSTRDLEAAAIRQLLAAVPFARVIEIGCGTGKNTEWLAARAAHVTAVDFSAEMLQRAQAKVVRGTVEFQQADITQEWTFAPEAAADLVTCSLILEHVRDLSSVFRQARRALKPGGLFYIGELHPFKQYVGSKARFDTASGVFELECYTHHVSEFTEAARDNGFSCEQILELFDDDNRDTVPRILALLFKAGSATV